jgi:hypothetical protein
LTIVLEAIEALIKSGAIPERPEDMAPLIDPETGDWWEAENLGGWPDDIAEWNDGVHPHAAEALRQAGYTFTAADVYGLIDDAVHERPDEMMPSPRETITRREVADRSWAQLAAKRRPTMRPSTRRPDCRPRPLGRAPRARSNHRRRGSRRVTRAGPSSDDDPPSDSARLSPPLRGSLPHDVIVAAVLSLLFALYGGPRR